MPSYDFKCDYCASVETVTCKASDYSTYALENENCDSCGASWWAASSALGIMRRKYTATPFTMK